LTLIELLVVIAIIAVLVTTGLVPAMAGAELSGPRRPNILVILADDLGYGDVGFHHCRDIPTPQIDRIAHEGIRCTNGYVSAPICSPSRAGLLTGRYPQRFGHESNPGDGGGLPLSETTLADRLRAAGYVTGLVGKWHLGGTPELHPTRRGFVEFFGFLEGEHPYFPGQGPPLQRGTAEIVEREYLTDALAREAVAFIDRHKDRPFFLYLAFNAVHIPTQAAGPRRERFLSIGDPQRRTYAAMAAAMDEGVGRVLAKLREENLEQETLVVFLSDNGGPTLPGTAVNGSRNSPLRGSKRTTLEGGIRVPFAARWPGRLPAGAVYEHPVIQLDLVPTVLAAAGLEASPEWRLDGVDLLPYWSGRLSGPPHSTLYWRFGQQMAIRRGDWKLVRYHPAADGSIGRSRQRTTGATPSRLYNLAWDLGETHDLAARYPETVRELEAAWQEWNAKL
jgi:arylsulfatase A-like enzyme